MPLHILLCDEVLSYFIFANTDHSKFKSELKSNKFVNYKVF
jgi:hypothetical protein